MPVTGEALVWWHWVVFGAGLLVADLVFINIYYLLWFGLGAIGVGLFLLGWPMTPFWQQIVFFGGLSAAMLGLWLVFLRPRALASRLREAQNEMPGQAGIVVSFANGRGVLRLQRPDRRARCVGFRRRRRAPGRPRCRRLGGSRRRGARRRRRDFVHIRGLQKPALRRGTGEQK